MADVTANFINLVKERSTGNSSLLLSLQEQELYAKAISLLRNDIEILLRIGYLLTIGDRTERSALMEAMLKGEEWKEGRKNITNADMAAIVAHYNKWISEVYDFGTLFTHITDHQDYKTADPIAGLTSIQKTTLRYYLSTYHQLAYDKELSFRNVINYLPNVATKVLSNLKRYLSDLEQNRQH